ncbi:MAG: DUF6798 domain-containing protein [Pseudomonadota bacterium]
MSTGAGRSDGAPGRSGDVVVAPRLATSGTVNLAIWLGLTAWFFLLYQTQPLYFSNQNTKFLHGAAQAGLGLLSEDWQANTKNGLPLFTVYVEFALAAIGPIVFYLTQAALFGVFLCGLYAVARLAVAPGRHAAAFSALFIAIAALSHFKNGGGRLWEGLAQQYLVAPMLEPQNFGVFFLISIALFFNRRPGAACWTAVLPVAMHPGYVVPGAMLLGGFLIAAYRHRDALPPPGLLASLALAGTVVGHAVFLANAFPATSPEAWARAAEIISQYRIPDHSNVTRFLDIDTAFKAAMVAGAVWLSWGRPLGTFIAVVGGLIFITSAAKEVLDSDELGLIAPWRASTYLVPTAFSVVLAHACLWAVRRYSEGAATVRRRLTGAAAVLALFAVVATGEALWEKWDRYVASEKDDYYHFVQTTAQSGEIYLTRVRDADFRMTTSTPQYVSWKTHPYQDSEVIEWFRRINTARQIFRNEDASCAELERLAGEEGVTHLVARLGDRPATCGIAREVFKGARYGVYRLDGAPLHSAN